MHLPVTKLMCNRKSPSSSRTNPITDPKHTLSILPSKKPGICVLQPTFTNDYAHRVRERDYVKTRFFYAVFRQQETRFRFCCVTISRSRDRNTVRDCRWHLNTGSRV